MGEVYMGKLILTARGLNSETENHPQVSDGRRGAGKENYPSDQHTRV